MNAAAEPIIEVRDLHFAYGKRQVLSGLTLSIPRGKVTAILGVSGSGKTTLLQLVAGSLRPARGAVSVFGKPVHELDQPALYRMRRQIGMMFQKGGLFTDLTVFDNIAFPIREHTKLPEALIRDLVIMKLHAVGLRATYRLFPAELSGGMSRRVALARAMALDPDLMIFDEPFAGLDPITLNVICNLIRTLNDSLGSTSVVVTYDVHEALKLADYLFVMGNGRIIGEGETRDMLASTDPFVHQFLHSQPDGPVPFHMPARKIADELGLPC